jgi:hypothetical protein
LRPRARRAAGSDFLVVAFRLPADEVVELFLDSLLLRDRGSRPGMTASLPLLVRSVISRFGSPHVPGEAEPLV